MLYLFPDYLDLFWPYKAALAHCLSPYIDLEKQE